MSLHRPINVLVSSAGRRGALVRLIKQTVGPSGGKVLGVDAGVWSSACRLADAWSQVPRCDDERFTGVVLDYCLRHQIHLIIPTIDTELSVYAQHRDVFREHGIGVAVSGPQTVSIAADKELTHRFLVQADLPTVTRHMIGSKEVAEDIPLPVIIKPRFGSASDGVEVAHDAEAFWFYLRRTPNPIVQQLAQGSEYTVNFFVDRERRCLSAVPHRRIETRGGEVSKCVTVKHQELMSISDRLARALPNAWGPMCFQAFVDDHNNVRIIELNPRFGGGYPIAHEAGVNFVQFLIDDVLGRPLRERSNDWREGVAMTRWDDAVFTLAKDVGLCA